MGASYTHTTRASGLTLTAAIYNADHQNHIDHMTPAYADDYSQNLTEMQTVTDPGELASESLATSTAGEFERLRYAIQDLKTFYDSSLSRWYQTPTQLSLALGTITSQKYVLNGTATWNSGGTTFTAVKVNVTDSSSAAASLLEDLQVGGTSQWKVTKAGVGTLTGSLVVPTVGPNSSQQHTLPAVSSDTVALIAATQTLTNKTIGNTNSLTVKDASFTLQDDSDTTKQAVFQLSGITTGTTRTFIVPNANTTLVGTDVTQTLSNKTIDTLGTTGVTTMTSTSAGDTTVLSIQAVADANSGAVLHINRTSNVRAARLNLALSGTTDWAVGVCREGGGATSKFSISSNTDIASGGREFVISGTNTSAKFGLIVRSPTNDLSMDGSTARTWWLERASSGAGAGLTIQSGGAQSGASSTAAGALTLATGISTGNAVPALIRLQGTAANATSATTDRSLVDRYMPNCFKVLTNNSAIDILSCTIASGSAIGGTIEYTIEVTDGTDYQAETGYVFYSAVNKAGTVTRTITEAADSQQALSGGTLATTWAISNASPAVVSVNANSSLTPSTGYPRITFSVLNGGQQAVAIA